MSLDNTQLLPSNFRTYAGNKQRISYADITRYIDLYTPVERMGLENNLKAYKWAIGYVPEIHNSFLSSGIGKSCVDVITQTAVNGKMTFNGPDEITEELDIELGDTFTTSVEDIYRIAASSGASLNRVCFNGDKAFISSVPLGQFKCTKNERGEIVDCRCYLDLQPGVNDYMKYVLYEHRYFNKEHEPKAMYAVTLINYTNTEKIKIEDYTPETIKLRKDIQEQLELIYPNVKLYKEDSLPFKNSLGATLTNWTETNSYYRSLWFGDAMLVNAMDELYAYDHAFTAKENDKYLGRGKALVPKQMSQASLAINRSIDRAIASKVSMANLPTENVPRSTPLDKTFYQELSTATGEAVKPTSIQFNLRTAEWSQELSQCAGDIAARVGISAVDLDPRLNGGTQRTATEINKESDATIRTVNNKRLKFEKSIVDLVKAIAYYLMGDQDLSEIGIAYPPAGLSNPQVATQVVLSQYQGRVMSRYTAIKTLHPDWSETDIQEEIARIDEDAMLAPEINIDDEEIN